jgi:hypothetical protein
MVSKSVRLLAGVGLAAPFFFLALPSAAFAQAYLGPNLVPYAVIAGQTVTCTAGSVVTGNVGVSPGTAITGFPGSCTNVGVLLIPPASNPGQADLLTAYGTLDALGCSSTIGPDLTNLNLVPGVYCVTAGATNLSGTLTLDAAGNPNASWTFQMGSSLITSPGSTVDVINGGSDCSVQWLVRSSATIDTGTTFVGNILALTTIAMQSGASLVGRALARNGEVTLINNNISFASCAVATPGPGPGPGPGPVPALSTWALIALVGLLALSGFATLRRRPSL